ncbi:Lrp/AsnC family transcriptional regulator [Candidatus Marsarchaeota archaeon]|jgi:hypothetical protein|nr:Lrp/AsnC family transcriptional regulator [Candidatus Marsarchaeota archaeon]
MHIRNRSGKRALHRFYLVSPKSDSGNAYELAETLLSLGHVEEVFMTEGKYGYIVKAKHSEGAASGKADPVRKRLSRLGFGCNEAVSYYNCKRQA